MERRSGPRAQVDFPLTAFVDGFRHQCRAVELSPRGMVVELTKSLADRCSPAVGAFELRMGGARPIRLRARTVWVRQRLQAVRFVSMQDADRLLIAEHLDQLSSQGNSLH
jgi:hypothetical protein